MQTIPVDSTRLGSLLLLSVAPETTDTGQPKASRDGVPVWRVEVLHRPPQTGDFAPRAVVEVVKVTAAAAPTIPEMTPVEFTDLVARSWAMGDRSGISLSADAVNAATRPARGGEGQ